MPPYQKKFVVLDLETTHLDIREGRIMEVGGQEAELFWDEQTSKIAVRFGEEFTSLVNPEIIPGATALMLTGIDAETLKTAPAWKEVKTKFQAFLGDAALLGHNIAFDLEYLEAQGLDLKNKTLDSLEIAQTFLPLFPTHSLEGLAEGLGSLAQTAHRALADCQTTALVLAGTLNEFLRLPQALQEEIKKRLLGANLFFAGYLLADLPKLGRKPRGQAAGLPKTLPQERLDFAWGNKTIYHLPLTFDKQQEWLAFLAHQGKKAILGLSRELFLDFLPEDKVIPQPSLGLCTKRWDWLKNQEKLLPWYAKLLTKILIFRHFSASLDISQIRFTASERQILPLVTADPAVCPDHACEYANFLKNLASKTYFLKETSLFELLKAWPVSFASYPLLLFNFASIEDAFTASMQEIWSLQKLRRDLVRFYPLEEGRLSFYHRLPKEVEVAANELDLFFGILHLVYRTKEEEFGETLLLDEQESSTESFNKILAPAEKLVKKMQNLAQHLADQLLVIEAELKTELAGILERLQAAIAFFEEFFFERDEAKFYWLRFDAEKVELGSQPKNLSTHWRTLEQAVQSVSIVDTEPPDLALSYYLKRLGLEGYALEKLETMPRKQESIEIKIFSQEQTKTKLLKLINSISGKSLVILPNEKQLAAYLEGLGRDGEVLRPGRGKNFGESKILLSTTFGLMRYPAALPKLDVLVMVRLPFEAPGKIFGTFKEHLLPRAVHLLHFLISRFVAAGGREVFIADPRILSEYDQAFMRYFEEFPDFKISTV